MNLRKASFGELFGAAFAVAASFHGALVFIGTVIAILNPGFFYTQSELGQTRASSPIEALGILLLMAIIMTLLNLMVSAGGAGVLILARKVWPKSRRSQGAMSEVQ